MSSLESRINKMMLVGSLGGLLTACRTPLRKETGYIGTSETGYIGTSETGYIGTSETGYIDTGETGGVDTGDYDEPVCICEERGTTIEFTSGITEAPVIGDLDGDGPQEIVINDMGASWWSIDDVQIIVAEYDAVTEIDDRWILVIGDRNYEQSANNPVIADIDNDGANDIVTTIGYEVLVLDGSGSNLSGWPLTNSFEFGPQSVIAAQDMDADGNLEIVISDQEYLSVFDNTGALMLGWPQSIPSPSMEYAYQPFSLADMNGDGETEIVCAIGDYIKIYDIEGRVLYSIASNTADVCGYYPGTRSLVGDVNADGALEIIAAEYDSTLYYMKIYSVDGTELSSFEIENGALFALADIDGGGDLEIVYRNYNAGAYDEINIYKYDGSSLPGWPIAPPTTGLKFYNPIVLDINGDALQEIVVGVGTGYYYPVVAVDAAVVIYNNAGTILKQMEYQSGLSNAIPYLAAGDVDGDGSIDLVAAGFFDGDGSKVRSWECSGMADSASLTWPMVGHDRYGTYNLTTPIE